MRDVDYNAWYAYYRALFRHAGLDKVGSAADVCCGTGAFAVRLAKDGARVTGVDGSPDMLSVAGERARQAGARAVFVRQDARKLQLPRPVEAILCACDGVNYLSSPQAARAFFRRAYAALAPGGALAFDVSTAHKFITRLDGRAYGEDLDDLCYLWTNVFDESAALCHMDLTLFLRQENGLYAKYAEAHTQRAHGEDELGAWLREAGFASIEFFSETTMERHKENDERMHVLAIKRS